MKGKPAINNLLLTFSDQFPSSLIQQNSNCVSKWIIEPFGWNLLLRQRESSHITLCDLHLVITSLSFYQQFQRKSEFLGHYSCPEFNADLFPRLKGKLTRFVVRTDVSLLYVGMFQVTQQWKMTLGT